MWGELNARNAFRMSGTRYRRNALLTERYLLPYSILYSISVPERVPDAVKIWKL
jgi:hypothetical protein